MCKPRAHINSIPKRCTYLSIYLRSLVCLCVHDSGQLLPLLSDCTCRTFVRHWNECVVRPHASSNRRTCCSEPNLNYYFVDYVPKVDSKLSHHHTWARECGEMMLNMQSCTHWGGSPDRICSMTAQMGPWRTHTQTHIILFIFRPNKTRVYYIVLDMWIMDMWCCCCIYGVYVVRFSFRAKFNTLNTWYRRCRGHDVVGGLWVVCGWSEEWNLFSWRAVRAKSVNFRA